MESENIQQEDIYDAQFGYEQYFDSKPKLGWLLSFNLFKNENEQFMGTLYFVDEFSRNFKVLLPFYPSLLIEVKNEHYGVEEYIRKKYEGNIQEIQVVERIDSQEYNHLNKPPKQLLKVYFKTDTTFQVCMRHLKELIAESAKNRHKNDIYSDFCQEKQVYEITNEIIQIHEFDIPNEIQFGIEYKIRCGSWYHVSYDGKSYSIVFFKDKVAYPDLRIFAFDIETTKPPLKFPNAEFDQVMMISIMTEEFGELIINRKVVSQDIQEFEYQAKDDMKSNFRISNEDTEEELLIRFVELIIEHRPHIITTYNGGFFDWPFIDSRMKKYNLSLNKMLQFVQTNEYYECPYIMHLDCYKWVKRDSYLPMNNQGLKDVTRIKLGYFPDEIDPEDMVRLASENPQKLASYSVSDAVATYYLYLKYVHSHIFSVSSIIPLPPVQILCKGAGTLCESLLLAESQIYKILVPTRKRLSGLEYYNGHIVENLTYVGGHVESLKAGIFRSDFVQSFNVSSQVIELIIQNFDFILQDYCNHPEYLSKKDEYIEELKSCDGALNCKGNIYHLDVGAMYPNIILTNRLQPYSVVNDDICIRCDFNNEANMCKKKLKWVSRAEYLPPASNEISMIKNQLENEIFTEFEDGISKKVPYSALSDQRRDAILKERILEYSRNIYKRIKKTEEKEQDVTICQREIPFYVETVRKFRDQRYVYKELYKKAIVEYEKQPTVENKKNLVVYNSLQVAYKCILNSFYGYVMREGSRWYSLEMAATVCNIGGEVIKLAKELVQSFGIPLELDTDGIWGIFPEKFPFNLKLGEKNISVLTLILNYFVCKKFTNYQYQILNSEGQYDIIPQNSIFFELDGPYKTMIIPSSTEENKLLKKRYVVFDYNNKICELKGFELKRRGELNFIKKFQEDIFNHFNDGLCLKECYDSLSKVCNYWLDIIDQKGGPLDEDSIFNLFSESRSMSKSLESYGNRKSNILGTARKLSEFLGDDILEEKLKCEFIMSKYPLNSPVADRAIPVMIFKSADKDIFLKKWLKTSNVHKLTDIIDWSYYRKRFESILQRLIVIPAYLQNIPNPIPKIDVPSWAKDACKKETLKFAKLDDIEDIITKRKLSDMLYTTTGSKIQKTDDVKLIEPLVAKNKIEEIIPDLRTSELIDYIRFNKSKWLEYYIKSVAYDSNIVKVEFISPFRIAKTFLNGKIEISDFERDLYIDVAEDEYFKTLEKTSKYVCAQNCTKNLYNLKIKEKDRKGKEFSNFLNHFNIKYTYNLFNSMYDLIKSNDVKTDPFDVLFVTSFNYQKKVIYCVTADKTYFISETKHPSILKTTLKSFKDQNLKQFNFVVVCRSDSNGEQIAECFEKCTFIALDLAPSIFLESLEGLLRIQNDLHIQMKLKFQQIFDIARFSNVPILNIDENILDYMLYKEFLKNDCIPVENTKFSPGILKEELIRSNFYNSYAVSFECTNSLILSIIEYKTIASSHSSYHGYLRKDFLILREFLKNLVLSALNNNSGTRFLLQNVSKWLKKTSKLISPELREVIEVTHQQFLVGLISKLKEHQYTIIAACKELIIIYTGKNTAEGCSQYIDHLKKKVSEIEGYELLNFKMLRTFSKLVFVDFNNFFFMENNEISGFSDIKMPIGFLKSYFSENEITNEQFFAYVREVNIEAMKLMLRILSYKRDTHGLASNCYKLKKCSEFEKTENFDINLSIFCKKCEFENILRKHCVKCYTAFPKESIEKECLSYLNYCWKMKINGDLFCNKCGGTEEKKLREYCSCGGKYKRKDYTKEISQLKYFVSTKKFDLELERFKNFFN